MSKAEWREGLSSEERDRAIESILDEALPSCEASYGRMRGNFAALSLRALFFGIEDCAILAGIITLAGAAPLAFIAEPGDAALAVFMLAPLFFAALQGHAGVWGDGDSAHRAACRCGLGRERAHGLVLVDAVPCRGEPRDLRRLFASDLSA